MVNSVARYFADWSWGDAPGAPIATTLVSTRGHHGTQGTVRQLLRSFGQAGGRRRIRIPLGSGRLGLGRAQQLAWVWVCPRSPASALLFDDPIIA